jgi:cellulose synthase/poly-beta-1,6-N-acetylglucosamine synthase-like glycosyltransferase
MADDASVIALVDSDYQARPTFLSALIGHFDDQRVGFVQSPHDYREWQHSSYQRMCYWEYRSFFTISVPSWNERGAAITVGTMSLIRRKALEEAGGWSEWCLTEDSELAPRIHSLGYTSVYVNESFGRGLIPETFGGYAKQRRRWTYGPIQELKAHLPMFAPRLVGRKTALTVGQKLFHLHHDLDPLFTGLGLLLMPIGLATTFSMLAHNERPALPWLVIAAGVCVGISSTLLSWRVQRKAMRCSLLDVFCAGLAKAALALCIATSALRAMFGIPLSWERTDKFKARSEGIRRALYDTRVELSCAVLLTFIGVIALGSQPSGLLLLLVIGILLQGVGYLTAPAVAVLAEWELKRAAREVRVECGAKAVA